MELSKIIEALKEKEIDGDVISAVKALDVSAEVEQLKKDLESEQGKNSGILADKKKYKDRAEKAEGELKKIEDEKLPEEEKHARQLQEIQDKLDAEKAQRESDKAEFERVQRDAKLSDITAGIKWSDGIPTATAKMIISNALTDVDLADGDKVDGILKDVKETHKSFIAAEAPGGSGGKGNDSKVVNKDAESSSMKELMNEVWQNK
jgi:hypothetical protein